MSPALKLRLKEPSTYVGLGLVIQFLTGKTIPPEIMASTIGTVIAGVVAIGGLLGMVLKEKAE